MRTVELHGFAILIKIKNPKRLVHHAHVKPFDVIEQHDWPGQGIHITVQIFGNLGGVDLHTLWNHVDDAKHQNVIPVKGTS